MNDGESIERFVPAQGVLFQRMPDGDSVLLHSESELYFGLDEIGTRVWEGLESREPLDGVLAALTDDYAVNPAQVRSDVGELFERLRDARLIEVDDE